MRLTWLADALRAAGLRVVEVAGWQTRGSADYDPEIVVEHHTASAAGPNAPSLVFVSTGSKIAPLCNLLIARDGTCYVVAAGRSNNAGVGSWKGMAGNRKTVGIESENNGLGEPWPQVQLDVKVRATVEILRHLQRSADFCCGHREWAPGRKIDPTGIDMNQFRARVAGDLATPPGAPPTPAPPFVPHRTHPVLRRGSKGNEVRYLQTILATKAAQRIAVDGDFGPATERSVKNLQRLFGLVQDGIVGPKTWECVTFLEFKH